MSPPDCCPGDTAVGGHPFGMHTQTCEVYLANCEAWERRQAEQQAAVEWQPGDPVHPAEPAYHGSCGPCLVRWTAEVDHCPECGELSTEALRTRVAALPPAAQAVIDAAREVEAARSAAALDAAAHRVRVALRMFDFNTFRSAS